MKQIFATILICGSLVSCTDEPFSEDEWNAIYNENGLPEYVIKPRMRLQNRELYCQFILNYQYGVYCRSLSDHKHNANSLGDTRESSKEQSELAQQIEDLYKEYSESDKLDESVIEINRQLLLEWVVLGTKVSTEDVLDKEALAYHFYSFCFSLYVDNLLNNKENQLDEELEILHALYERGNIPMELLNDPLGYLSFNKSLHADDGTLCMRVQSVLFPDLFRNREKYIKLVNMFISEFS